MYTFTNVVDSTQQQISTIAQCLAPSINGTGELAFLAGSGAARGVYKGSGGALTLVADESFGGVAHQFDEVGCRGPSINDAGKVAFYASTPSDNSDGLYVGDGATVSTIADSTGPFARFDGGCCKPYVMLNEAGDVAFIARFDSAAPQALYLGDENGVAPLYDASNTPFVDYENGPSLNDAGFVAFWAFTSDGSDDGLFVGNGGALSKRFDYNSAWCALSLESGIDANGLASLAGDLSQPPCTGAGIASIHLASPTAVTPLVSGPVESFWFDPPSFSNNGQLAFNGGSVGGGNGVFFGGQVGDAVVRVGDALFGSTVTSVQVGRQGANDAGQVAFWYQLADGRTGYGRADPIPDCQNGLDDDADGKIDLLDAGCSAVSDLSERTALYACDDGLDNDGDALSDFPFDPGCVNAKSKKENPACNDGLDNDGDTFIDFPADRQCKKASGGNENPPPPSGCGIGPELLLAVPLLAWARRRRLAA